MSAAPAPTPVLDARGLSRTYHQSRGIFARAGVVRALTDVSFTLAAGETLAVVGESGSGKSTLARLLTLVETPTAGALLVDGADVAQADAATRRRLRRDIQMVFQNPYGSLTAQFASAWAALRIPGMTTLTAGWARANLIAAWTIEVPCTPQVLANLLGAGDGPLQAVAREIAAPEVVLGEGRVLREPPGERALVEHHAHDDGGARLARHVEKLGGGLLLEEVVDHLHGVDPAVAHEVDDRVLVVLRRRDADQPDLALVLERSQASEGRGVRVPRAGPGVELEHVDPLGAQIGEPLREVLPQVRLAVARVRVVVGRGRPVAGRGRGLRGDGHALPALDRPRDEPLALAVPVAGGGVDEVAPEIQGAVERGERVALALRSPTPPDGPRPEPDLPDVEPVLAEGPALHEGSLPWPYNGPRWHTVGRML